MFLFSSMLTLLLSLLDRNKITCFVSCDFLPSKDLEELGA